MRLAESDAADPPLQLPLPTSAAPGASFLPASRPGLPRPVASKLRGATARTLPGSPSPLSRGAPSLPRPPHWGRPGWVGTWLAGRPRPQGRRPRRSQGFCPEEPGGEAGTHLSPARSVFGPVSSAAAPAPPHPPQQEVTSSAAFVTSILSGEGGGGGGALLPVSQQRRAAPHPAVSPFPFSFPQTPASARTQPSARAPPAALPAQPPRRGACVTLRGHVRHARGGRQGEIRRDSQGEAALEASWAAGGFSAGVVWARR